MVTASCYLLIVNMPMGRSALALSGRDMRVIGIDDPAVDVGRVIGAMDYDTFLPAPVICRV